MLDPVYCLSKDTGLANLCLIFLGTWFYHDSLKSLMQCQKNLMYLFQNIQFRSNCKTHGKNTICIIVSATNIFK